jgi:hypothetical protein
MLHGHASGTPRERWFWNSVDKRKLLFCSGLCRSVGVFLGEAFDTPSGVNKFLFPGEKGMAIRTNFHAQHVAFYGRARWKRIAASAVHCDSVIVGVNSGFHEAPVARVRSARHDVLPRR